MKNETKSKLHSRRGQMMIIPMPMPLSYGSGAAVSPRTFAGLMGALFFPLIWIGWMFYTMLFLPYDEGSNSLVWKLTDSFLDWSFGTKSQLLIVPVGKFILGLFIFIGIGAIMGVGVYEVSRILSRKKKKGDVRK